MLESEIQVSVRRLGQKTVYFDNIEIVGEIDLARLFHLGRQFLQTIGALKSSKRQQQSLSHTHLISEFTIIDTFLIPGCLIDNIFDMSESALRQEFMVAGSPPLSVDRVANLLSLLRNKYLPNLTLSQTFLTSWDKSYLFRTNNFNLQQYQTASQILADLINQSKE